MQAGIGRDRIRRAVAAAAQAFDLHGVWSLGFVGGLRDVLRPGALVCPAVVLDDAAPSDRHLASDRFHAPVCSALRHAGLAVEVGALVTVGVPQCTTDAKRRLGRRSGAMIVDMEAAEIVRAARDLGLPWVVLKTVVDAVDEPLPAFLVDCATPEGGLRWSGVWAGLRQGRASWRALRRIGRASRLAGGRLRRGLEVAFSAWAALTPV
jgi:nucleoside phosphorylase